MLIRLPWKFQTFQQGDSWPGLDHLCPAESSSPASQSSFWWTSIYIWNHRWKVRIRWIRINMEKLKNKYFCVIVPDATFERQILSVKFCSDCQLVDTGDDSGVRCWLVLVLITEQQKEPHLGAPTSLPSSLVAWEQSIQSQGGTWRITSLCFMLKHHQLSVMSACNHNNNPRKPTVLQWNTNIKPLTPESIFSEVSSCAMHDDTRRKALGWQQGLYRLTEFSPHWKVETYSWPRRD